MLIPQYSRASGFASPQQQSTASSADTTTNGAICNGESSDAKHSTQSSSSEGGQSSNNKLRLSTKSGSTASEGDVEAQGQFCKRDRKDEGAREASSDNVTPKPTEHVVPQPAPKPIAMLSNGKLTIKAEGENLSTILSAVKAATGITIEGPGQSESERMYLDIGPVPVRDALVALLEGSNYNYLIQSSAENPQMAKRLVLTARTNQAATTVVASTQAPAESDEPSVYGAVQSDDQQAPQAQAVQAPLPVQPTAVPSSVPTGINVQKMAEESHRTVGEVLSDLQKQQEQMLDNMAAQQQAQQPQPPQ